MRLFLSTNSFKDMWFLPAGLKNIKAGKTDLKLISEQNKNVTYI